MAGLSRVEVQVVQSAAPVQLAGQAVEVVALELAVPAQVAAAVFVRVPAAAVVVLAVV